MKSALTFFHLKFNHLESILKGSPFSLINRADESICLSGKIIDDLYFKIDRRPLKTILGVHSEYPYEYVVEKSKARQGLYFIDFFLILCFYIVFVFMFDDFLIVSGKSIETVQEGEIEPLLVASKIELFRSKRDNYVSIFIYDILEYIEKYLEKFTMFRIEPLDENLKFHKILYIEKNEISYQEEDIEQLSFLQRFNKNFTLINYESFLGFSFFLQYVNPFSLIVAFFPTSLKIEIILDNITILHFFDDFKLSEYLFFPIAIVHDFFIGLLEGFIEVGNYTEFVRDRLPVGGDFSSGYGLDYGDDMKKNKIMKSFRTSSSFFYYLEFFILNKYFTNLTPYFFFISLAPGGLFLNTFIQYACAGVEEPTTLFYPVSEVVDGGIEDFFEIDTDYSYLRAEEIARDEAELSFFPQSAYTPGLFQDRFTLMTSFDYYLDHFTV